MRATKRFLITVAVAVVIISLIGAIAAITVSVVGKGTSYAFWSESHDVLSIEISDTTALAKEINPSEKYIEYDYYVIDGDVWTLKTPVSERADEDGIDRPRFNQDGDVTTDGEKGTTNIKAVVKRYSGNISTLNVPDATPVYVGNTLCKADVVEIAALNMETSPGVAIVDKLIIGRNVQIMGYSRGESGAVISSGMYGFYALKEVLVVRTGTGSTFGVGESNPLNGYFTEFDKITAVGHFFEDSPNLTRLSALIYSNINTENDAVPQIRSIGSIGDVFVGQTEAPSNFVDTGIDAGHAIDSGFKLSTAAILKSHNDGLPIYKDFLRTEQCGTFNFIATGGSYKANITVDSTEKSYTLKRSDDNKGEVYDGNALVGRYEYAAYSITITIYETDEDGNIITDDLGVEQAKAKYFY